jgi:hypothetical protein
MKKLKIFEFLKEDNGTYSSTRLFALMIVLSAIVEWQKNVWTVGLWHPDYLVVGLIAGVLGIKVLQKKVETKIDEK